MEKLFEVKTTLSLEDNLALHRLHGKGSQQRTFLYVLLAAVAALYLWIQQDKYAVLFTLLTVVLLLVAIFYNSILGRLSYNRVKGEICENTYSFYQDKIGVRSKREDSLNDYTVFTKIYENSSYYFLYTQGTLVIVLPKRDFIEGSAADFGAFISGKIGQPVQKLKK